MNLLVSRYALRREPQHPRQHAIMPATALFLLYYIIIAGFFHSCFIGCEKKTII